MKKKRNENLKIYRFNPSNSSAGNGGGAIDGSCGGIGGVGSGVINSMNPVARDYHHNTATPCCNLARDIAREIFPSLDTSATSATGPSETRPDERNENGNDDGVGGGGGDKGDKREKGAKGEKVKEIENGNEQKEEPAGAKKPKKGESNGKKKIDSSSRSEDSSTERQQKQQQQKQQQQQPLFGYMIQNYLIQERKRTRLDQGCRSTTSGASANENVGSKKKKKKKRKKKGATTLTGEVAASASASTDGKDEEGEDDGEEKETSHVCQCEVTDAGVAGAGDEAVTTAIPSSASDAKHVSNNGKENFPPSRSNEARSATCKQSSNLANGSQKSAMPPHPPECNQKVLVSNSSQGECLADEYNTETEAPTTTGLDRLLDSLINSPKPSQTVVTGGSKMENRDIDSFVTFLGRKFQAALEEQQQRQSQPRTKEKVKESSNPAVRNEKKGGTASSKSASSTSEPSNDLLTYNAMELKDVLPTISLNEVYKHASEAVSCRVCRTSSSAHLRALSGIDPKSSANGTKHVSNGKNGGRTGKDSRTNGNSTNAQNDIANRSKRFLVLDQKSAEVRAHSLPSGSNSRNGRGKENELLIPVSGKYYDDIDSAFDYMALEDADSTNGEVEVDLEAAQHEEEQEEKDDTNTTTMPSFQLVLQPISRTSDEEHFLQIGPVATEGDEGVTLEYPMNSLSIMDLMRHVVLPCGMEQAKLPGEVGRPSLKNEEYTMISDNALKSLNAAQLKFVEVGKLMKELNDEFKKADDSVASNRTCFDSKSSQYLMRADKKCEEALTYMGSLLLYVTKMSCFVGWSSEYGPFLMKLLLEAWDAFDSTLDDLVEPTMRHRGKVIQTAGRPGVVPQAYLDSEIRRSLHQLIATKVSRLVHLHLFLKEAFYEPGSKTYYSQRRDAATPLVRLSILGAYLMQVSPSGGSMETVFPNKESESQFESFLSARIKLSQKTIICNHSDKIKLEEKENLQSVQGLHDIISKSVKPEIDLLLENFSQPDFLRSNYYDFNKKNAENQRQSSYGDETSSNPEAESLDKISVENTRMLLNKSRSLATQWIYLLCMRQYEESSCKVFSLPSQLKDWLESICGSDFKGFNIAALKNGTGNQDCDGFGGKRRVSSVLASLLYRWFEDRCSEWHAELTRDELLLSMDMEGPTVESEGGTKAGKKKKSKRNKGKTKDDASNAQHVARKGSNDTTSPKLEIAIAEVDDSPDANFVPESSATQGEQQPVVPQAQLEIPDSCEADNHKVPDDAIRRGDEINQENADKTKDETEKLQVAATDNDEPPIDQSLPTQEDETEELQVAATDSNEPSIDQSLPTYEQVNVMWDVPSNVGVLDGKSVVLAETFLVKRLEAILELMGTDSMPHAKKAPVVVL